MREPRRSGVPFYVKLECNCDAATKGGYLVCYHKCAVYLYWKYNKLVDGALENGGEAVLPEDWENWYRS